MAANLTNPPMPVVILNNEVWRPFSMIQSNQLRLMARSGVGDSTKWSMVYDLHARRIYFK